MSADAIVFAVCCTLGLFALGIEIGQQHRPPACPVVPGEQVVSTTDDRGTQTCVYARSYGRALRKVRL